MSYAYTHLKHKAITDIRIFRHSYNELIQLLMLIQTYAYSDLYLKHSDLISIADLFLFGTYTYNIRILYLLRSYIHGRLFLIPISRRTHTYSYSL